MEGAQDIGQLLGQPLEEASHKNPSRLAINLESVIGREITKPEEMVVKMAEAEATTGYHKSASEVAPIEDTIDALSWRSLPNSREANAPSGALHCLVSSKNVFDPDIRSEFDAADLEFARDLAQEQDLPPIPKVSDESSLSEAIVPAITADDLLIPNPNFSNKPRLTFKDILDFDYLSKLSLSSLQNLEVETHPSLTTTDIVDSKIITPSVKLESPDLEMTSFINHENQKQEFLQSKDTGERPSDLQAIYELLQEVSRQYREIITNLNDRNPEQVYLNPLDLKASASYLASRTIFENMIKPSSHYDERNVISDQPPPKRLGWRVGARRTEAMDAATFGKGGPTVKLLENKLEGASDTFEDGEDITFTQNFAPAMTKPIKLPATSPVPQNRQYSSDTEEREAEIEFKLLEFLQKTCSLKPVPPKSRNTPHTKLTSDTSSPHSPIDTSMESEQTFPGIPKASLLHELIDVVNYRLCFVDTLWSLGKFSARFACPFARICPDENLQCLAISTKTLLGMKNHILQCHFQPNQQPNELLDDCETWKDIYAFCGGNDTTDNPYFSFGPLISYLLANTNAENSLDFELKNLKIQQTSHVCNPDKDSDMPINAGWAFKSEICRTENSSWDADMEDADTIEPSDRQTMETITSDRNITDFPEIEKRGDNVTHTDSCKSISNNTPNLAALNSKYSDKNADSMFEDDADSMVGDYDDDDADSMFKDISDRLFKQLEKISKAQAIYMLSILMILRNAHAQNPGTNFTQNTPFQPSNQDFSQCQNNNKENRGNKSSSSSQQSTGQSTPSGTGLNQKNTNGIQKQNNDNGRRRRGPRKPYDYDMPKELLRENAPEWDDLFQGCVRLCGGSWVGPPPSCSVYTDSRDPETVYEVDKAQYMVAMGVAVFKEFGGSALGSSEAGLVETGTTPTHHGPSIPPTPQGENETANLSSLFTARQSIQPELSIGIDFSSPGPKSSGEKATNPTQPYLPEQS
ncbi:hypothetical protein H072_10946 [Dactylellina haptotyla CBS 200.50]|uniref:Uncharacterized protein n=1 Tax=Dactylellina haptotyla (strain CBS 200.50) TaxID=1284197 RepID=S8A3C9_DACHA|nr:hypothetical protein H072_10946 [Dactylellina haptotyla CBS 200.50]